MISTSASTFRKHGARMMLIVGISVIQPEGVNCIPVVVDLVSLGLLKGE